MTALDELFRARKWTPFAYQREVWDAYRAGRSGLVHAPTGTGKTLAAWLGALLEAKEAGDDGSRCRVVWLTPLRALAHDTVRAHTEATDPLGVPWSVELRTGDTPQSVKTRQRRKLPACLVTTPESLTILLSYAGTADMLRDLRCVVVDEWHELLATKRGVQTELALARLRALAPELRTWGLSATIANLDEAADALLGPTIPAERRALVRGAEPRDIEVRTVMPTTVDRFPWSGHIGIALLDETLDAIRAARSTLLFTNTRSQAEIWFRAILHRASDLLGRVALHHGSLDRDIRRQVEELVASDRLRCVVCTSSLDLGVDFTPVDQVIQVGSPRGVARLMQRAGRSGHRPGVPSRILCVPTHAIELVEFAAARDAVADRAVEPRRPLDRPLDVLVQHLVTMALGGGFDESSLRQEVRTTRAFRNLTDEEWSWAMQFVSTGGPALGAYPQHARIAPDDESRWVVPDRRIQRTHRMSIGAITSDSAMRVKFQSGKTLGTIEESFIARLSPGDRFVFAGRVLELLRVRDMTAWVSRANTRSGVVPRWNGGKMPLSSELAAAVRRRLDRAIAGDFDGPEMTLARPMLELQQRWSVLPASDELLIERTRTREGHHAFLFFFAGRHAHEGLGALLAHRLAQLAPRSVSATVNDYGLELLSPDAFDLDEPAWRRLIAPDRLLDDLLACVNASELSRRQFREIARIAGLIFQGFPGAQQSVRHLQASSELFFDVFTEFDPGNLLLDQARREVMSDQLEVRRLADALDRAASMRIVLTSPERLTPLAFPLYAETLRTQHVSSEAWSKRIERMVSSLERAASTEGSPPTTRRTRRRAANAPGRRSD
ncbi:MAG: ligase-associated DNA damage response DEXH box helicase [Phycisphaerales bacterium]